MNRINMLNATAVGDREIVITRDFDAPRHLVFEAHTRPDLLKRWLLGPPGWTMPVCEIDLRVGGKFRFIWRKEDGTEMGMGGTYREIAPPERIVQTELFDEDWTGGETLNTTTLAEQDGRTTLTVAVRYASIEARDAALNSGMTDGMSAGYERLDGLLASSEVGA